MIPSSEVTQANGGPSYWDCAVSFWDCAFFLFVESVFLDWTGRSLVAVRMPAVLAYGLVNTFDASFCSVGVLSIDALWVLALDYWSFPCTVTG